LLETNKRAPNGKMHRYQSIWVIRDDKPAEYRRDMGLASKFKADDLFVLGGIDGHIEETVGSLRIHAEDMRNHPFDKYELTQLDRLITW